MDERTTFFNLSNNPDSLSLMMLDVIAGPKQNPYILVLKVFRGKDNFALMQRWQFDCQGMRSRIVQQNKVGSGEGERDGLTNMPYFPVTRGDSIHLMLNLTCTGKGDLPTDRVYHMSMSQLLHDFYNRIPLKHD